MTELIKPPTRFWLSVCPFRTPIQKLHTSLGHARNAVGGRSLWGGKYLYEEIDGIRTGRSAFAREVEPGQIWEWNGSDWDLVHDIPKGTLDVRLPWRATDLKQYEFYVED